MKSDEPAFPILIHVPSEYQGLTKREYAAIKIYAQTVPVSAQEWKPEVYAAFAKSSVLAADALIEALNK